MKDDMKPEILHILTLLCMCPYIFVQILSKRHMKTDMEFDRLHILLLYLRPEIFVQI